jgi:hypothetical protein
MPILGPMIRKIKNLILSYRDTILALKASGVSISTLSGATCSDLEILYINCLEWFFFAFDIKDIPE